MSPTSDRIYNKPVDFDQMCIEVLVDHKVVSKLRRKKVYIYIKSIYIHTTAVILFASAYMKPHVHQVEGREGSSVRVFDL